MGRWVGVDGLHPGISFVRSAGVRRKRGDRQQLVMDDGAARQTGDSRASVVNTSVRCCRHAARSKLKVFGGRERPTPSAPVRGSRRRDAFETLLSGVISHQSAHWRLLLFLQPKS